MNDAQSARTIVGLVIDDDKLIRVLARNWLERDAMQVHEADDGESGLAAIAELAPDIILLDVMMPGMDGFEVCRRARKLPGMEFCPIVMLTGLDDTVSVARAYEAGATDFVTKPINWALFEHRVRFVLKAAATLAALHRTDLQLANAQRLSQIGSWEWRLDDSSVIWSEEMYHLCGIHPTAPAPGLQAFLALVHSNDRPRVEAALLAARAGGPLYDIEFVLPRSDGSARTVHAKGDIVLGASGLPVAMCGTLQDITNRKQAEEHIHFLVNFDALTKLPNRNFLRDRLLYAISLARRQGQRVGILCLDLDAFKFINDSNGHAVGDNLLKAVAGRLTHEVRESDTLARLGGDEFAVLCPGPAEPGDVAALAQKIIELFHAPFQLEALQLRVTASIGIALFPDDGHDVDVLLKHADVAMYAAKESGRNCFQFYSPDMGLRVEHRVELETTLRFAVEQGQFEVYYQPKVDLRSGRASGVEALIRWHHPQRGLVAPDLFIPIAEETGLIVPIGQWVLHTACTQMVAWHKQGFDNLSVAVNLSAYQFKQKDLAQMVERVLAETGLPAKFLELELTESSLMADSDAVYAVLCELKAIGISLALDDFGTGYSSLSYLKRFPIDVLKIDRSFIHSVTSNPHDATLTRAIVLMARALKLRIVAEGVETEGQLGFLDQIGCHCIQGFLISRPVNAAALAALLLAQSGQRLLAVRPAPRRTLLLLDDEPHVLSSLNRLLRHEGYQILQANDARQAFELLAIHPVQVIISDQRMPGMTGTAFLSAVKEMYPATIRIILSGYTEVNAVIESINLGAVYRFLSKPWNDQFLIEQVQQAFDHHALIHGTPDACAPDQPDAHLPETDSPP